MTKGYQSEQGGHGDRQHGAPILQPRQFDILSGKDKQCVGHEGSKRFRAVIESYRHQYSLSKTKYEKMKITKEIYESLNQSCRFLKIHSSNVGWEELSPMAARDKVGHALRFANRTKRRRPKKTAESSEAPSTTALPDRPIQGSDIHQSVIPIDMYNQSSVVQFQFKAVNEAKEPRSGGNKAGIPPLEAKRASFPWSPLPLHKSGLKPLPLLREISGVSTEGNMQGRDQSRLNHKPKEWQANETLFCDPLMPLGGDQVLDWDFDLEISPSTFA